MPNKETVKTLSLNPRTMKLKFNKATVLEGTVDFSLGTLTLPISTITGLTETSGVDTDYIMFSDTSDGGRFKKITLLDLATLMNSLLEDPL